MTSYSIRSGLQDVYILLHEFPEDNRRKYKCHLEFAKNIRVQGLLRIRLSKCRQLCYQGSRLRVTTFCVRNVKFKVICDTTGNKILPFKNTFLS